MSKEKQIEEMAKDLGECHTIDEWAAREYGEAYTDFHATAEKMLDRGWIKQSEGEWKQTEEPMGWHDVDCVECSACGESWVLNDNLDFDLIVKYWHYCPNCGAKMKGGEDNA